MMGSPDLSERAIDARGRERVARRFPRSHIVPARSGDIHSQHAMTGAAAAKAVEFLAGAEESAMEITLGGGPIVAEDDEGHGLGMIGLERVMQEKINEPDADAPAAARGIDDDVAQPEMVGSFREMVDFTVAGRGVGFVWALLGRRGGRGVGAPGVVCGPVGFVKEPQMVVRTGPVEDLPGRDRRRGPGGDPMEIVIVTYP